MTVEREFGRGTVLEVAYAGSKGTHLQRRYDINQPGRDQALRSTRPYAGYSTINVISDSSNSIYNSGARSKPAPEHAATNRPSIL